jgi:beta-glucosidase
VEFSLPASSLAYWSSDAHRWVVEEEPVEIAVGASSADTRVRRTVRITGH